MEHKVKAGIIGAAVGDALGVPAEFMTREQLRAAPVTDMVGGRLFVHDQPIGTWSDDTSLTLCLLDSLGSEGLDYTDIMNRFISWIDRGEYTAGGGVFDYGNTTRAALARFERGTDPRSCGGTDEADIGNGSLMRILPIAFYLHSRFGAGFMQYPAAFEIIHDLSSLTHAHDRCKIACGIYIAIAGYLLNDNDPDKQVAVSQGCDSALAIYKDWEEFDCYARLYAEDFAELPEAAIGSSGYVVDTLEAAIWCLLTTDDYSSAVLKAVNLGGDTDTVAAVTGGLAGLLYGYEAIPTNWRESLARLEYIEELCSRRMKA